MGLLDTDRAFIWVFLSVCSREVTIRSRERQKRDSVSRGPRALVRGMRVLPSSLLLSLVRVASRGREALLLRLSRGTTQGQSGTCQVHFIFCSIQASFVLPFTPWHLCAVHTHMCPGSSTATPSWQRGSLNLMMSDLPFQEHLPPYSTLHSCFTDGVSASAPRESHSSDTGRVISTVLHTLGWSLGCRTSARG